MQLNENCVNCPVHNTDNLIKLGIDMSETDYVVALAGNPNTGKSTVFNSLTGLKQHTGNWPGKTVARAEGGYIYGGNRYKIVDLPGAYSLLSTSADEEIARNFILFGQPDVTIIVVDATRLERNLNLVIQVLEITDRAVLCVNLIDEAKRHGIEINNRSLAKKLGIPVVLTAARQKEGIKDLIAAVNDVASGKYKCNPYRISGTSKKLDKAIEILVKDIRSDFPNIPNPRWIALRLLEGDQSIIDAVRTGELSKINSMRLNEELQAG